MVINPRSEIWQYFDNILEEGVAVCILCKQRLKNERTVGLKRHFDKLHNPKTEVWKYFTNMVAERVAECKLCKKHIRNNRHFNLLVHLKTHDIIIPSQNPAKKDANLAGDEISLHLSGLCIMMEERTLVKAIMDLMINEGVACQTFSSKNMKALLDPLADALSRQNDTKFVVDALQSEQVVQTAANFIRDEFANDLSWRLLSLKIDADINITTANTFFLSVQFVSEAQVKTVKIGEINLDEQQKLSCECITKILRKFNIDVQQIVSVYWDNTKAKFNLPVENSDYLREIQEFQNNYNIFVGRIKVERYVGVIAQYCILDVLKNPLILKPFLECRKLIKFLNNNLDNFRKAFKKNKLNIPKLDSPWQWGSTYNMMNDLKNALDLLVSEQPESFKGVFRIDDNLKNFIIAFCEALSFIQKCLQKFYQTEMIYGDFYAEWLKCKLLTQKLNMTCSEEKNMLSLISFELLNSMTNRSDEFLNQDHFKACLYLDPRFQSILSPAERIFAIEYLKQLWNQAKLYNANLVDPVTECIPEKLPAQTQNYDDDDNDVLNEFLSRSIQDNYLKGIDKKLEELKLPFQMAGTKVLTFWDDLKGREPEVYNLVEICFAIPATQNYYKMICRKPRPSTFTSNISSDLREELGFIRLNQNLLNKAIETMEFFRVDAPANIMRVFEKQNSLTGNKTADAAKCSQASNSEVIEL